MDAATFGDPKIFKTLPHIMRELDECQNFSLKRRVARLLREFNEHFAQLPSLQKRSKDYYVRLMKADFLRQIAEIKVDFPDATWISLVSNFLITKFRCESRPRHIELHDWTIEPIRDMICQHGLDLDNKETK